MLFGDEVKFVLKERTNNHEAWLSGRFAKNEKKNGDSQKFRQKFGNLVVVVGGKGYRGRVEKIRREVSGCN